MKISFPVIQTVFRLVAWIILLGIVVSTLVPINLRPMSSFPSDVERFTAYALLGLSFGVAYPRARRNVLVSLVLIAALLEVGQHISSTRHATLWDFVVKSCGSGTGFIGAIALDTFHFFKSNYIQKRARKC